MGPSGLTGKDQRKTRFMALAERYCQLGRLLPALDDIDTDDTVELAEIKTVLLEMAKTKAELDELLRPPD